ncbi:unnamed protein product [Caenorhabditis auriculariae]|uniref:Uncharacterized protein n=1 Tax=Caenorhabditis auriculariae TaxID=2777116 RepID=A0A8S1H1U1_9PELO|nr:unnamed protein product [Caenorhabditis auriculariae]
MGVVSTVLTLDAAFAFVTGTLLYFAPHFFSDILFQRKSDGVHWHLVRCIGGQILASSFVSYRFRNSSGSSHTVCHIIRVIPSILLLVLLYQCQSMTPDLIPLLALKGLKSLMFFTVALHFFWLLVGKWQVGNQLCKSDTLGNFLYQLDAVASVCIGAAWMTFPKWLLHRQVLVDLDESHELCGRVMGALFISSYVVSTHALYWESQRDRNVAIDGRVLCCLSILAAQLWSQTYESWSGNHWIGITLFSTWTVISLIYRTYIGVKGKSHRE